MLIGALGRVHLSVPSNRYSRVVPAINRVVDDRRCAMKSSVRKHAPRKPRALCLILGAVALPLSLSSLAQWDPSATADLGMGYGQAALSQTTLEHTMDVTSEGGEDDASEEASTSGQAPMDAQRLQSLTREYRQRVERDGVESARAWAFELGRRDAHER
ncbi:hypothetical protein MNO14_15400 [Luteimonas sp. S4-F44]|uniref:hypothetical protein n=1 Tax=Luteimonas sp. S4-F44 TaxID=2925842 RepID=UPI001F52D390|nr:hypothetical protein [Luteimonas sp. S4-F44]UNK42300.1 hypothetical protein MNO14_15400 [Luteimonas sp. S4-F44]